MTYEDVYNEIKAQIRVVEEYGKGKFKLDHIDTHHILQDNKIICRAINDVAKELNLPTRHEGYAKGLKSPDVFCFDFTIENVNLKKIREIIKKYKNTNLTIELCTHSGYVDDETKKVTSYLGREKELEVLRDAKRLGLFEDVELINFSNL